MRHLLGNPADSDYYNVEAFLNELTIALLASSTKKALAVVVLDSNGDQVSDFGGSSSTPTTMGDNSRSVTTAGTRVQLSASSVTCVEVTITAKENNSGVIVVGGSTCVAALSTRRGTPLRAGESMTVRITNLNAIYLDSTVSGESVTYSYLV